MCNSSQLLLIAAILLGFLSLSAANARAQAVAGTITTLAGAVHIERAGSTSTATVGMALKVGDRIVTGANGRVTITLADKSKLEVAESTSLVIDQEMVRPGSRSTKLSLFAGLVRSFVSYSAPPKPSFEVHTPNAVASARGTEYDTETDTKERKKYKDCRRFTQVSVYKGTVEVTNTTNPSAGSVEVHAGYKTLVACGYAPESPSELGAVAAASAFGGGTAAGLLVGGAIVTGGTLGGLAGAGVFSGGGNSGRHPTTPAQ
jgi:ferric-dicitrate binding protein FerR (iron transport regulator)